MEPCDNVIATEVNLYSSLIHVIKQSTPKYYNIRMILCLKCTKKY